MSRRVVFLFLLCCCGFVAQAQQRAPNTITGVQKAVEASSGVEKETVVNSGNGTVALLSSEAVTTRKNKVSDSPEQGSGLRELEERKASKSYIRSRMQFRKDLKEALGESVSPLEEVSESPLGDAVSDKNNTDARAQRALPAERIANVSTEAVAGSTKEGETQNHSATKADVSDDEEIASRLQRALAEDKKFDFLDNGTWRLGVLKITRKQTESVSEAYVRSLLNFKEGDAVSKKNIHASIKRLYESGWVKNCDWGLQKTGEGTFDLHLTLDVCPKVSGFYFEGVKFFKDKELIAEMKSRVYQPLNEQRLQADRMRLLDVYHAKGFFDAEVEIGSEPSQEGYEEICVFVKEGRRHKIRSVSFEGVTAFKQSELKDLLQTKSWNLFSFFSKSGRIEEEKLQEDIETLRNFYINAGYLDVKIDRDDVILERAKKAWTINEEHWNVIFCIDEGECYRINNTTVSSDQPNDNELLRVWIGLREGSAASPVAIENACEFIREFYGCKGYATADVQVKRTFVGDHRMDVHFTVQRGQLYRIHSIYLTGNSHTKSKVILRELNMAPGDIMDLARMRRAEARLQNTGFFKSVALIPEDCDRPGEKDLRVAVEENKTGNIAFTGGFDNVSKFNFGITLSQNNFDWQNSKDYFRGAGQKFQIGTSLGKYTKSLEWSFEEPWLYDRELAFGFSNFISVSKLDSKSYKQRRIGGEVYLRKRLFEQVIGKLYYHLEHFKLTGVDRNNESQAVLDEQGGRVISKIGFLMERDTRNHFIYPTRGTYISWDNQFAGLGGATKYFRTRVGAAGWYLVSPNHEQVLMVGAKAGYVRGLFGKNVSLYEREFLGGPDDLRGFDYHEVGPKAKDKTETNLGGQMFWFAKTEYSIKLHDIFRVVGFCDVGALYKASNEKYHLPKSGGLNADAGFGFRIHILGTPLRLDFAFPLRTDPYNRKSAPHIAYSFGTSF